MATIQSRFLSAAVIVTACSVFWLAACCSPKESAPAAPARQTATPTPVQPASEQDPAASRPDPLAAFAELAKKAEADDVAYVRAHLAEDLSAKATQGGADPSASPFLKGLMAELKICQPTSWKAGTEPNTIIVETKSSAFGRELQFLFDFVYDPQRGWLLASHGYGRKPIEQSNRAP